MNSTASWIAPPTSTAPLPAASRSSVGTSTAARPTPAPVNVSSAVRGVRKRVSRLRQAIAPAPPDPHARRTSRRTVDGDGSGDVDVAVAEYAPRRVETDSACVDDMNAAARNGSQSAPSTRWPAAATSDSSAAPERASELADRVERDHSRDLVAVPGVEVPEHDRDELEGAVEHETGQSDDDLTEPREPLLSRPRGWWRCASTAAASPARRARPARRSPATPRRESAPIDEPIPIRHARQPRRSEAADAEQADRPLAIRQRLGGDHPRIDRLRHAGDDARSRGCRRRRRHRRARRGSRRRPPSGPDAATASPTPTPTTSGGDGADDHTDLLGPLAAQRTPQEPPAQARRSCGSAQPRQRLDRRPIVAPITSMNASSRRRPLRSVSVGPVATSWPRWMTPM